MAIRRFFTAKPGVKSNQFWDQDTAQGAMEPIASQTQTGGSATISFVNIPQTYQDLFIVVQSRSGTTSTYTDLYARFGTGGGAVDSGNNYSTTRLLGDGGSASSDRFPNTSLIYCNIISASSTASGIFASSYIHILNYRNSTGFKNMLVRGASDSNGTGYATLQNGLWRNTGAITSIDLLTNASFAPGSTFTLYGIKAGA
jgi:hypothetical protein